MKAIHYLVLLSLLAAMIGMPAWYAVHGKGAEAVPGTGSKEILRNKDGRVYVGGGPRTGK